jgi:replicative DNA helicase
MNERATTAVGLERRIATDRVPPHSDEAEISVLGGMMLEETAADRAMEILTEDDFYHPAHRRIFHAIAMLRDQGHAPDAMSVREELRRHDALDEAGGADYLARIVEIVPTAANLGYHARLVLDASVKRRLITTGTEIVGDAYQTAEDAEELLDKAEARIFRISERRYKRAFVPINQLLQGAVLQLESLAGRGEAITGAPSGFSDLDDLTAGFQLGDLIIVAARPSLGKCLARDSEIVLSDGSVETIEELHRRRSANLLTLGGDLRLRSTEAIDFIDDGEKPVFRVTTRLGRVIETTLSHPFLTIRGWTPLAGLRPGDRIAVPRRLPVFGTHKMRECEIKLLAYLIGDGGLTGRTARFTNTNYRLRDEFTEAAGEFGGVTVRRERTHGLRAPTLAVTADPMYHFTGRHAFGGRLEGLIRMSGRPSRQIALAAGVHTSSISGWTSGKYAPMPAALEKLCNVLQVEREELVPEGLPEISKHSRNRLVRWLDELCLMEKRAAEKSIPAVIFTLGRDQLALFLNRLFATDGWASVQARGRAPQIGYCTTSERLARQIQHLLLRFGIVASLRKRSVTYRGSKRFSWQLDITDQAALRTFIEEIGIFGKEAAVDCVRRSLEGRNHQTNTDLIPLEIWQLIAEAKGKESWRALMQRMGLKESNNNLHVGRRALSRKRLAHFAAVLDRKDLRQLSESDVYWDRIVSIEHLGNKQVYDLTIPETHNFVANDVCVHNTSISLSVAANAAILHELPVAIFSLEMSTEQLVQRLISMEAMVSLKTLRTGRATSEEWKRVADACDRLRRAAIYIDDTALLSPLEMRAKARRLKQQRDIGLVVVDYLQLMQGGGRSDNRQQEISEISRSLKALSKELNVPVIALSQLSRAPEQRSDQRPKLSDLRESGAIEQDADLVLFLYRDPAKIPSDGPRPSAIVTEIIIGKNRNGPTGSIELVFQEEFMRFMDLDRWHQP